MVKSGTSDPVQWKKKGDSLFKSGDYVEAVQAYRKAIELDPGYIAAWNNLGYSLIKSGRTEEARDCFEKKEELALHRDGIPEKTKRQVVDAEIQEVPPRTPAYPVAEGDSPSSREDGAAEPASRRVPPVLETLSDPDSTGAEKSPLAEGRIPGMIEGAVSPDGHDEAGSGDLSHAEMGAALQKATGELPLMVQPAVQAKTSLPVPGSEIPAEHEPDGLLSRIQFLPFANRPPANVTAFYFLSFFIIIILLAYIIPLILSPIPSGSDVYFHMVSTERMYQSDSLVDFLDKSRYQESLGFDYPFGMWYFGSILMKMTGISVTQLVSLLPIVLVLISFVVFYVYAQKLLRKKEWAVFSLIFLISMPLMAINLLNFQTSRFISVFLIMILLIVVDEKKKWQNLLLVMAIPFIMAITHTGTYMFLIFFSASYLILYALFWKKFDWWMFLITVTTLFMYVIAVQQFQFVQPQYVDKGRLIISVTDKIASFSGFDIVRDMGSIFYDNIFVTNNMSYVVFWSAMIFSAGMVAIWIHRKMENHVPSFRAIPLVGSISDVSHSFVTTPFWIGPVQSVLSIFGIFALDSKGKCIFLAIIISAVLPATMQSDVGTGALRQIYYLFLIIPVTAAAGMMVLYPKVRQWCNFPKKKVFFLSFVLLIFLPLICAPIVGSIYYVPNISGTENEKENLVWLGTVGSPQDGVADYAYRERVDVYAQKETPDIPQGMETRRYLNALRSVYFSDGSESSSAELYSYSIHYLISSERILSAFNARNDALRIDTNTMLDKVFSSDNQFGIYHINAQSSTQIPSSPNETISSGQVRFDEQPVVIEDVVSSYLVESPYYKIRLGKAHPSILYLGTGIENMLGDGILNDQIIVSYRRGSEDESVTIRLSSLNCDSVVVSGNTVQYRGIIPGEGDTGNLATIHVIYTFLEKSMKIEVRIANDQAIDHSAMNVLLGTSITSPASSFDYLDLTSADVKEVNRRIYPSQDTISIRDVKTNRIYLDQQGKGILIYYGDSSPYPDRVLYKGSEINNYGYIYAQSEYPISQGDVCQWVRYFTVGEKQAAIRNIEEYTSVSVYDYPEGIIPLVVLSPHSGIPDGWAGILNHTLPDSNLVPYDPAPAGDMKDYVSQRDDLAALSRENGTMGIVISNLQYNLETIQAVSDNSMTGIAGFSVNPPFYWLFKEGRRNLKEAYYQGEQVGVILVPISLHQSGVIGRGYSMEDLVRGWTSTIDTVVEDGGIAVFFWDPDDFTSVDSLEKVNNLLSYAESKGMNVTSLDPLIDHKLLLKNVAINVEKDVDSVILEIRNNNQEHVQGFTTRVVLPEIEGGFTYQASEGGRIVRVVSAPGCSILFVSCDLAPGEAKKITIEPSGEKKRFGIDFTKLYHGTNTMVIRDDEGNTVGDALVRVGTQSYRSDEDGIVTFYVRAGETNISVEKPGFRSRNVQINIKTKFSKYFEGILD